MARDYHVLEKLGRDFRAAQAAFEAASPVLDSHVFDGTSPTNAFERRVQGLRSGHAASRRGWSSHKRLIYGVEARCGVSKLALDLALPYLARVAEH